MESPANPGRFSKPLEYQSQRVGKYLGDGTEVFLFHGRFPADRRQKREKQVLATFGANAPPYRSKDSHRNTGG